MCSSHGCCDHGIHSERNTPRFRHGPDRPKQSRDIVFGGDRGSLKQNTVSQPREVTRLSSRPDRRDRRDKPLHSHSDSHMNARYDTISNSKTFACGDQWESARRFFRKWAMENASMAGSATAKMAVFSGNPSAVDHLLGKCKVGPPCARVANVAVTPAAGPPKKGFEQLDDKHW